MPDDHPAIPLDPVAASSASRLGPPAAGAILAVLILAQLTLGHPAYHFSRMFWFDEIVTHILVTDPDPAHAASALWNGVDNNAPALYIGLKAFTSLAGTTSESAFRAFSLLSVMVGLFGIYLSLTRCFSRLVSFVTVVAIWTHPLILRHAFNARFYGPLFAAAVWFAYLLSGAPTARQRIKSNIAIAVSAVILCTVHYFGVFSLLLVLFGEALQRRRANATLVGFGAATAGLLALGACAPLLMSHVSTATVRTWVPPPNISRMVRFGIDLMLPAHLAILPLVAGVSYLMLTLCAIPEPASASAPSFLRLAGLSMLALTPLPLIAFSYVVQPVLSAQYAIPAVAGVAPGIALVLSRVSRVWLIALCAFFLLMGAQHLRDESGHGISDQRKLELISVIRRDTDGKPVIFENLVVHEIAHYAPDLSPRLFHFDEGDLAIPGWAHLDGYTDREWKTQRAWQIAWTRRYAAIYRNPSVVTLQEVRALPAAYLVLGDDPVDRPPPLVDSFYGLKLRHVERNLYEIVGDAGRPDAAEQP